nr:hypothetical protein GCM10020092_060210 [Actinoplanes digitatis]
MAGAAVVRGAELLQAQHAYAPGGQVVRGRAAHAAEPHHDDVVNTHEDSYRRMRSCLGSNSGSAATVALSIRSK